ncbi:MAG TPA: GNAT family N-acetyltransferase, partial [Devosia sp.]|nr:GNAT family N-acetyltransferase [Devosia sp.]
MSLLSGQMQSSPAETAGPDLDFVLFDTLEAANAAWRALEQQAILTPYQRFDWVAALIASGTETADRIAIALIRQGGQPVALLPLAIERRLG